ncbi:putative cytochrome P450 6a17 [Lycorma delicatula]|uniref:putative cytochrome P450 6a17 n=1 Tax=Lycorma delicatula TaxID=130591 RepID=UPI003F50F3E4
MLCTLIITTVLAILVLYFLHWLNERNTNYWKKKGVPVISSSDQCEIFSGIITGKKNMIEMFNTMYKKLEGEKFGGYFQILTPTIMIRDIELINRILIQDFTHFEDRGPPQEKTIDLFGLAISNLCGDEWRAARHKLTPTFTSGKLKMMFEPIKECSEEGVLFLKDKMGQDIEALTLLRKIIVKIIASAAFGLTVNTFNEKEEMHNDFIKSIYKYLNPSRILLLKFMVLNGLPILRKIFKFKIIHEDTNNFFLKLTKDIIKFREETGTRRNDFIQLMIEEKKKEHSLLDHEKNPISCNEYENEDKELLDQLNNTPTSISKWSKSSEFFTEEFIAAQTLIFMSVGSDSTATTLSFVLYELAVNQDVQKRVKKEISDILSCHEFDYQSVKRMVYLEQSINETLRLHAIIPVLTRNCTKEYKIPGTNVILEKGTAVFIPTVSLHMDPQYFPDPNKFNPDRFTNMESIPKGVFFPFGSGPRICIAVQLVMLEMKIILANLLLNYTVVLSEKTKLPLKITKHSVFNHVDGGIWIKFKKDN